MSFVKHYNKHGCRIGIESSYGSDSPALSNTTDGFLLADNPDVELAYQYSGQRQGKSAGGYVDLRPVAPIGALFKSTFGHYWRGPAGAYSSSVFSSVHAALQLLGMSATFASAAWTYQPISDAFSSGHGDLYMAKEKWGFSGAFCDSLEISSQDDGPPMWKFSLQGIGGIPTDVAVPAITYPFTSASPRTAGMTFALSTLPLVTAFSGRLVAWTFKLQRELVERVNQANGTTHGGIAIGKTTATLDFTIEATALGGAGTAALAADLYRFYDNGTLMIPTLQVNPGNSLSRYKIATGSGAILTAPPKRSKNGPGSQWEGQIKYLGADDNSDIDVQIITD
jgi:hypothetical protein